MSVSKDPLSFPEEGVTIATFKDFIDKCGGREKVVDLTTADIIEKYLKPMTKQRGESYISMLKNNGITTGHGHAKVFISHAWKYKFLEVVDALENHFQNDPDIVLWFDAFGQNQHAAPDLDFNWWATTFKAAIKKIGHTVLILAPWSDPVPLTRAWCLWEIYCTNETQSRFDVAMAPAERASFLHTIRLDFDAIQDMIARVDAHRSDAWNALDKERIFAVVRNTVGFDAVNSMVFEQLRVWVISVTRLALDDLANKLTTNNDSNTTFATERALLQLSLARLLDGQGKYEEARPVYAQSLAYWQSEVGADFARALDVRTRLGMLSRSQGDLAGAESVLLSCCSEAREAGGGELMLGPRSELGTLYYALGRYDEAAKCYSDCADLCKGTVGQAQQTLRRADQLASYNRQLAGVYLAQGRYEEAEPVYLSCIQRSTEEVGADHEDTMVGMNNLAILYEYMGKCQQAEDMYSQVLSNRRVKLGDDDPSTLESMQNMSALLIGQRRESEGLVLLEECLERQRRVLGERHMGTLTTLCSMAACCAALPPPDDARAEQLYGDALAGLIALLGDRHPQVLMVRSNLGLLLRSSGRLEEAQAQLAQAASQRSQELGPDHPSTLTSYHALLLTMMDRGVDIQGTHTLALDLYTRRRQKLGETHPDTLQTRQLLAEILLTQGETEAALSMLRECCTSLEASLGAVHSRHLSAMNVLARAQSQHGQVTEAQQTYLRQVQLLTNSPDRGPDHDDTVNAKLNLAALLFSHWREDGCKDLQVLQQVEKLYLDTYASRLKTHGDTTPQAYDSLRRLVDLYVTQMGKYEDAEPYLRAKLSVELMVFGHAHPVSADTADVLVGIEIYKESTTLASASSGLPDTVNHPFHSCVLERQKKVYDGRYGCDMCALPGIGWAYSCSTCGYDVHPVCCIQPLPLGLNTEQLMPAVVECAGHVHPLSRRGRMEEAGGKAEGDTCVGRFVCGVCDEAGATNTWVYLCVDCGYTCHPLCCLPPPSASPAISETDRSPSQAVSVAVSPPLQLGSSANRAVSVSIGRNFSIDAPMVDESSGRQVSANGSRSLSSVKLDLATLRTLRQAANEEGLDLTQKEKYLSDLDFAATFDGLTKAQFYEKPKWKRDMLKKRAGLF